MDTMNKIVYGTYENIPGYYIEVVNNVDELQEDLYFENWKTTKQTIENLKKQYNVNQKNIINADRNYIKSVSIPDYNEQYKDWSQNTTKNRVDYGLDNIRTYINYVKKGLMTTHEYKLYLNEIHKQLFDIDLNG